MKKILLILLVIMMVTSMCTAFAEEWVCPSCKATVSGNFCNNCGTAKPSDGWICPNCGNDATGNFCSNCGTAKPVAEWICPNCGEPETGKFCSNCGTAYTTSTIESTPELIQIDFQSETEFEAALNRGEITTGKVVRFKVDSVHPQSAMGFNLWPGEHLNFISASPVDVKAGDVVIARITNVVSSLRSWFLSYDILRKETVDTLTVGEEPDETNTLATSAEVTPTVINTNSPEQKTKVNQSVVPDKVVDPVSAEAEATNIMSSDAVAFTPTPAATAMPSPSPTPTATASPTVIPTEAPTELPIETPTGTLVQVPSEGITDDSTDESAPKSGSNGNWLAAYGYDSNDVVIIPADVLYEYGSIYVGRTVVTAITVNDKASRSLKANTPNNETYSFSVVAEFSNINEISSIKEGNSVIVVGTVDEMNSIDFLGSGKTVTLRNARLVTAGITIEEIEATRKGQLQNAKEETAAADQRALDAISREKQKYMDSCENINYSDIERNPKQYKGKRIKVAGTVIQAQEGWFNSVTLRVKQKDGNIWYITYKRESDDEPRILENDNLTFYGECTGVESYTTIVRSTVTIPAMDAKYYK